MPEDQRDVKISVRELVEFALRQGSIDNRYQSAGRALDGTRAHQAVQRRRKKEALLAGGAYEPEVRLKAAFDFGGFCFHVDGRADGVLTAAGGAVVIEEIKSTTLNPRDIEDRPEHWHWAQAKCYGHLYCLANGTESVKLRLTYVNIDDYDSAFFEQEADQETLSVFFFGVVAKYARFARMDLTRVAARNETAKALPFPFPEYRKSQRAFAVAVYKTIKRQQKLFVQAPTGTGKTISALFPAVKALSEGLIDKIFYATAKTTTRKAAEDAFKQMEAAGLSLVRVTLTAKDKICFTEEHACNPDACPFADGHFDRVNDAILDTLANESALSRNAIESYARKHRVCPFELGLDLTLFADCIICDYNYIYDPKAALRRFFGEEPRERYAVLHDEAHNLVERARDMFSASFMKSAASGMRKQVKTLNNGVYKTLGKLLNWFKELDADDGARIQAKPPEALNERMLRVAEAMDKWMAGEPDTVSDEALAFYFAVLDFLRVWELFDERFVFMAERNKKETAVRLLCLDPSYLLAQAQKKLSSAVFFSATLTPLHYFRDVLGGGPEAFHAALPSPFPRENLCLVVDGGISTVYKDRGQSARPVAARLFAMFAARPGNYFAFFPSYAYMSQVYDAFTGAYPDVPAAIQSPAMNDAERAAFLEQFSREHEQGLLGFTVMGGVFSEGIDLTGDKLIGAAVVGVGLPMITPERGVMLDYYNRLGLDGFNYAYVFPGMNKVMQAAGRVIRSMGDRGVVLLLDNRFLRPLYKDMFPAEWGHFVKASGEAALSDVLKAFWERN